MINEVQNSVIVTGASRGIGFAIAERLLKAGYRVVGCSINPDSVSRLKSTLPAIEAYICDVTQKDSVKAFAQNLKNQGHSINALINNAGRYLPGQIHNEPDGILEEMLLLNLQSAYYVTRAFIPDMIAQKQGTIINICSTASIVPYVNGGSYCVAKHALLGFSKVLREEMKPYNVRVTAILPGATLTDSWAGVDLPASRFIPATAIAEACHTVLALPEGAVIEELLIRPMAGDI